MRIGLRLHDAKGSTLEEKLESAASQGFVCAHIALSKIVEGFTMPKAPELLTREYALKVRTACERFGVQPVLFGCYLNLATPDPDELKWTLECYRAHIRFVGWVGAGAVVGTETGAPNREYRTEPACFTQEALELLIERIAPLAGYASQQGTVLAIEPVVRHIVSTPERARAVLDAVGQDSLKIIFDPVNLLGTDNEPERDEIFRRFITLLGDDTRLVHLKDYRRHDIAACAAGQGCMDYREILDYTKRHDLPITLEDTKPDNAQSAQLYLQGLAL